MEELTGNGCRPVLLAWPALEAIARRQSYPNLYSWLHGVDPKTGRTGGPDVRQFENVDRYFDRCAFLTVCFSSL